MADDIDALMSAPQVRAAQELYATLDAEAVQAQAVFKKTMTRANQTVLVAGIAGGLLLASGILASRWAAQPGLSWLEVLPMVFGLIGSIAGVLGTMWLYRAKQGEDLKRWMRKRAAAETARRDVFMALVREPGPPEANGTELALLKLEHVCRSHVEHQRNWYRKRAGEHRASAERTLRLGSIAAGLGAIAAFAAGATALADPAATALGTFTVIGAALATFAATREEIHQDRRNAERYESARDALTALLGKTGEVEAAIRAGATDALAAFVAAVHEQLLAEHQQWLAGTERVADTLGRLEGELAREREAAQARGKPPSGEPEPQGSGA